MDKDYYKNMKWETDKYTRSGDIYTKISYDSSISSKANFDDKSKNTSLGTGKVTKDNKEKAQNVINLLSKKANTYKNAFNKVSAACLKEAKFYIAQDRMLVAKAVAYRPKNESTELVSQEEMDFFGDIAAWEVETDLR